MTILKKRAVKKPGGWLRRHTKPGSALRNGINTVGAIIVIFGGFYVFDDRYAHASDTSRQMEMNRLQVEISVLNIRRGNLEDKVYDQAARESTQRQKLNTAERISFERYKAELNAVTAEIAAKNRQLERVRTGR